MKHIAKTEAAPAAKSISAFPALGAQRLFILGGLALILLGMIFGDVFAVFLLHQNAARIGENLLGATRAVAAGDVHAVESHFQQIGGSLENRGTKVDTHVHSIVLGYAALLLALLQPYVAFSGRQKKQLAVIFIFGATLLPVSVFLIHYVGLAFSPLPSIGWASILADFGGLLVILVCAAELYGIGSRLGSGHTSLRPEELLPESGASSRALLSGGTLLILLGFLHGAYYAGVYLYEHEERDVALLRAMADGAATNQMTAAGDAVQEYGRLQAEKAVHIAAHAHSIEFGVLALLAAFIQPFVFLSAHWKRRWAAMLLLGSLVLPVAVLLELRYGLLAGGIADLGGLLVIVALAGMLVGVLRYTGKLDAQET